MFDFLKKKKPAQALVFGLDLKRCAECTRYTRPCFVNGNEATFHRWVVDEEAILCIDALVPAETNAEFIRLFKDEDVVLPSCHVEKRSECRALIEWPNGKVVKAPPDSIRFADREED